MTTEKEILALADNMAAAASQLSAMTYDTLMSNREELRTRVHELFENLDLKKDNQVRYN